MRVLFLTHRLPFPPNRGDRIRAFHIIRSLVRTADVEVVSLVHDDAEAADVEALQRRFNIRVTGLPVPGLRNRMAAGFALAGTKPLTHVLLDSPQAAEAITAIVRDRPPDVVLAYCSGMARFALEPPLAQFPLVIDLVDLDSAKWSALAKEAVPPMRWIYEREARRLGAFECRAIDRARATLVVNEREADAAWNIAHGGNIQVVRNGVDVEGLSPPADPTDAPRVVFCGVMDYAPNAGGVVWFAREVWPQVRKMCPSATFAVVGADPTATVRKLADPANGIEVTGRVSQIPPHLWNSAVSIAPLRVARGLQNKVLEAVAAGLPAVVTTEVFEGLPNEVRPACRLADSADDFARHTIRLLRMNGIERRAIASRATLHALSWEQQMSPLAGILANAAPPALRVRSAG